MSSPRKSKTAKKGLSQRVAAGVVAGKKVTQIARDEKISRATASRVANSPETQIVITALVEQHRDRIGAIFAKSLGVVDEALDATKTALVEGCVVDMGADHYARLTAVKRLNELLTAGRQAARPEPPKASTFTVEELRAAIEAAATPKVAVLQ